MKNGNGESPARNIIAQGTHIQGDIESGGDFRIEGSVNGTVKAKGKIVVGVSGRVEGQMICQSADISGKVKIKLEASDLTSLRATSEFIGDIATKKISIEPGAVFSGSCQMSAKTVMPKVEKISV
ncbi:MAG: polymer-forming cytoskeletal protein [bacterium]|jgi:cytoskeletal protein CcmA (bactofilin family)